MPRFHFGSIDFAKDKAKALRRALEADGVSVPLGRCQDALSRTCGYDGWAELASVTRAKAHPKSAMGEVELDPAPLAHALDIDEASAIRILSHVMPDGIVREPPLEYDDISDLTRLAGALERMLEDRLRHVDDRFLVPVAGAAVPEGVQVLDPSTIVADAVGLHGFRWRNPPVSADMPSASAVRHLWRSLLFAEAERRFDAGDKTDPRYSPWTKETVEARKAAKVAAMVLPHPVPDAIDIEVDVHGDRIRFRLERREDGIHVRVLARVRVLATMGLDDPKAVHGNTKDRADLLLVVGDRERLLDVLARRGTADPYHPCRVHRDPDDATLARLANREPRHGKTVVGLPETTAREAFVRVWAVMEASSDPRSVTVLTVKPVEGSKGRFSTSHLCLSPRSSWSFEKKPLVPARPLRETLGGIPSLPVSPEAAEALGRVAEDRCSFFVRGDDVADTFAAMAVHRLRNAPSVADDTFDAGVTGGANYVGETWLDWTPIWKRHEIVGREGGRDHGSFDGVMYHRMREFSEMPPENFEALRERRVAFVDRYRIGRPCPHCSTTWDARWVMGDDAEDMEASFDAGLLEKARYRYPFGCRECQETGYLGTTGVVRIHVPSFASFDAVREKEKRRYVKDDPLADEWERLPPTFAFDHVRDAETSIAQGLLDPVDWMRKADHDRYGRVREARRSRKHGRRAGALVGVGEPAE